MRFLDGTYIVTGAAGGIGRATVEVLARQGLSLLIGDLSEAAVDSLAQEMSDQGMSVRSASLDVGDEASVSRFIDHLDGDRLRGLVNVAGVMQQGGIDSVDPALWDRVMDVNLRGTYLTCRACLPLMKKSGGGSIVNISSAGGQTKSYVAGIAYGASKGGVISLTKLLATQEATHGVRVNCVAPGNVVTPMYLAVTEEDRAKMLVNVPMGRPAAAQEVADSVAFLLSEQSSYITGQSINVNGGLYM